MRSGLLRYAFVALCIVVAAVSAVFLFGGYVAMTLGAGIEMRQDYVVFRAYSAEYYSRHFSAVDALPCNREATLEKRETIRHAGPEGHAASHPMRCILPQQWTPILGSCPFGLRELGYCYSMAFTDEVWHLPGFVEGLMKFLNDPCHALDVDRGMKLYRSALFPKSAGTAIYANRFCSESIATTIAFVDDKGEVTSTLRHLRQ